jgi:hypothetical protein
MALTQAEEIELLKLFAEEELYQARNRLLTTSPIRSSWSSTPPAPHTASAC